VADAGLDSTDDLLRNAFADALAARLAHTGDVPSDVATDEPEVLGRAPARDAPAEPPLDPLDPPLDPPREPPATAPAEAGVAYAAPLPRRPAPPRPRREELESAARPVGLPTPVRERDEEEDGLVLELERSGIAPDLAAELVDEVRIHLRPFVAGSLRSLTRAHIAGRIRTAQGWTPEGSARRIALVGGSGVGKTSTVAKLAAGYAGAGLRVGVVVVDAAGGDAVHPLAAQLGADADRLLAYAAGSEVVRVRTPAEAGRAQARLASRDVVLVDTPGVGAADDARAARLAAMLRSIAAHETHLTLPLGLAAREAGAALERFARLGANRVLVTKTDEARFPGPLLELATRSALPLSYLGEGPDVPGNLRPADGGSIARRILPI
jgi:flagellar biosynthesis protein FlhF